MTFLYFFNTIEYTSLLFLEMAPKFSVEKRENPQSYLMKTWKYPTEMRYTVHSVAILVHISIPV